MNSKDEILKRLRQVSYIPKDEPVTEWKDKSLYANYPGSSTDLFSIFKEQLENLSGEVHIVNDLSELQSLIPAVLKDIDPAQCRAHHSSLFDKIKDHNPAIKDYFEYLDNEKIDNVTFSKLEVGITAADALIARTGSILLQSISAGGRRLSVLPPTHVVFAATSQLVFSLDEAFENLAKDKTEWSYATVISGPSRTADIEKQLVLGAHGPKRLIVFVLAQDLSNS
jgi:L-lactate dehydrogenase complex protein LldG